MELNEIVYVNKDILSDENHDFLILLSFYGKTSPNKSSSYFINLKTVEDEGKDALKIVHENILYKDFQNQNNIDSRDFLIRRGYKNK